MADLDLKFLGFDVFGTVVDWRSGVSRDVQAFSLKHKLDIDSLKFADDWRGLYQPAMETVRSGKRPFVKLEVLNRENLIKVMHSYGIDPGRFHNDEIDHLNRTWERLDPWPDSIEGIKRLRSKFAVGPLSNGHIAGMMNLARYAGLTWDVIGGAELSQSFKPLPETYLKTIDAVGAAAKSTAMVAAHNADLLAARSVGMRTVFVRRTSEYGEGQTQDLEPSEDWDVVADSLMEVADALGC